MKKQRVREKEAPEKERRKEMGQKREKELQRENAARPAKERMRNEVPPEYKAMSKRYTPLQKVEKAELLLDQTKTYFDTYLSSTKTHGRGSCICW